MNEMKTGILLAGMTALFMAAGFLLGGEAGMLLALAFAVATNFFAYWNADSLVLKMYKAREVSGSTAPEFYGIVEQLARKAALPMPRVYIIENEQPNAFATGRNPENAAVALFFGNNRNNPLGFVGTILVMVLAPIAAMLVQMAISRTREYSADQGGAMICGNPMWLASALQKLERGAQGIDNDTAEANPATAHMFIVNPLRGRAMDNLFSTHPSTQNRVRKLREIAGIAARPWG
jgi:heat shock protein HtpX